jgi:hypothetical protein
MQSDRERTAIGQQEPDADGRRPDLDPSSTGPRLEPTGPSPERPYGAKPDHDRTSSRRQVTVQEAADALGISVEAVRARIKRGTLDKDKAPDGTVYVWLDAEQTREGRDQTGNQSRPGGIGAADRSRGGKDRTSDRAQPDAPLLEALRDQIEMLRTELEDRKEEARRKDAIIMSLSQRIPELEAPSEPREASEEASEVSGNSETPPEPARRRSWLYRFFFGP